MAWYNNLFKVRKLFGSTFYSHVNTSQIIGRKQPIWIDTGNLAKLYECIPEVRLVVDMKASMFSNMKISVLNSDNEVQENHEALKLLANPNPLQSGNEWLSQYSINKSVYGNAFITKLQATTTSFASTLYILPSGEIKIIPTGKLFKQSRLEEIIDFYQLKFGDTFERYDVADVLHKNDVATDNYLVAESRLKALQMPISNIEGAYKTRNILINEKGALGILSNANKDSDGGIPLNPEEKARIQEEYQSKYGIGSGQDRIIVTNSSLNWQPMGYPVKELMLFEEIQEDFNKIVDAFGLNLNIFSQTSGSTFENVKNGLKGSYENTIIPEANDLMQSLTTFLRLDEQGLKLQADYSHLPLMQEDEKAKNESQKINIDGLLALEEKGIISKNDVRRGIGEEPLPELEPAPVVVSNTDALEGAGAEVQDANALAQASLRGSVGGVQGILQLQASFTQGITNEASAISILMEIYGFDVETSRRILGL